MHEGMLAESFSIRFRHFKIDEILFQNTYNRIMKIIKQLEDKHGFSYNEKIIADYILEQKSKVLSMSAAELAEKTYTSPAAVIRLCKRIGLSGYQEFKILFSAQLEQHTQQSASVDANLPFHADDGIREISVKLEKLTAESLHEARSMISSMEKEFSKAGEYLMNARHTVIFGVGDAFVSGLAFQARMMRAGFSQFLTSPVYGEQRHLAQTLTKEDCGIVLSYSGSTESTLECARVLQENRVPSIALTSNRSGELAALADVVLFLPDREKKYRRYANFSSQACMEYYLNVLYSWYIISKYDDFTKVRID